MKTCCKLAADLAVGDLIAFLGSTHRIVAFEPYVHPTFGWKGRIARCERDWSMVVYDRDIIEVAL